MSSDVPSALRRLVRDRAQSRCEYCLLSEDDAHFPHEPDHIIAAKHGGEATADNLAYSCLFCNRHKGSDIGSIDPETGMLAPLFDPRRHLWEEHFAWDGVRILPLTPEGRVAERLLQLNHPDRLLERAALDDSGRHPPETD